jgi:hypothetical protein
VGNVDASTRLQHQVHSQLAQHGKYFVQPQSGLALLESVDKARGHVGERGKLILAQSQLKSPAPDLLRPGDGTTWGQGGYGRRRGRP